MYKRQILNSQGTPITDDQALNLIYKTIYFDKTFTGGYDKKEGKATGLIQDRIPGYNLAQLAAYPMVNPLWTCLLYTSTVYNLIHIGNARPMIIFDTVRRYLEYKGYEVNYVSNFTDVDDKIIKKMCIRDRDRGTAIYYVLHRAFGGGRCEKRVMEALADPYVSRVCLLYTSYLSAAAWQTDGRYFYRQPYCNDHSI